MCENVARLPVQPEGGGGALTAPWLMSAHTLTVTHTVSLSPMDHTAMHTATVSSSVTLSHTTSLSHMLSYTAMLPHLQPVTLSHPQPCCHTQKYRRALNNSGHTHLQPRGFTRLHGWPDTLTLPLYQCHPDQQRHPDILCLGASAAVLARWPHRVPAPLSHKEGKQV